ncbi:MAG TPA: pyridoxal phosphate-dependent aminotransferase [Holophagaceae bacterium]|nr:pyridoxal phosphate-dependent aminotransferase [Holophagaceae bacterium]
MRLPSAAPNALARRHAELKAGGRVILDLTLSNPTRAGFDYPEEAIRTALADPGVITYQPEALGPGRAREAVGRFHGVDPSTVILSASTSEAYGWLFKLLTDPGDDLLVPSPSYPLFDHLAALEGLHTRAVPSFLTDRWHLDLGALEAGVTPRTRAVIVVSPNNPTGGCLDGAEWEALTGICARHGLALIVDEVFADYRLEPGPGALPTSLTAPEPPCETYVLSGLSKVALLPQLKVGWTLLRGPRLAERRESLELIADQYLSVSAPAALALPALLKLAPGLRDQALARLRANLAELDRQLPGHPHLSRLPVEGGWSVILRLPAIEEDEAVALRLLEAGVAVHPGHFFDLPSRGFLVLSLLTPPTTWDEGLRRALPLLGS